MQTSSFIAGGVMLAAAAGTSSATTHTFNWTPGTNHGIAPHATAGQLNWLETSFNSITQELSWTINIDRAADGTMTDFFTLAINNGPNPKGTPGELAMLYFDASGGASNSPIMSVYGYNGRNNITSHMDGSDAIGRQAPDRIASSLTSSSWIVDRFISDNNDGSRTMGFTIDASGINAHDPMYGSFGTQNDPVGWTGMRYDEQLGFWFHNFSGVETSYDNGWLDPNARFTAKNHGWFDASGQQTAAEPVPEPTTIALMGAGLIGLIGRLRRRKRSTDL